MSPTPSPHDPPHDSSPSPRDEQRDVPPRDEAGALVQLMRASTTATMLCGDRATPLRYVIDGADGAIICPVESELLGAEDYTLLIPDDAHGALQIHAAPTLIDQRSSASCDRHMAYHGVQDPSAWVSFKIFSARADHPVLGPIVADGADLMRPNALRSVEPRLCKALNADPARVAAFCLKRAGVAIERPLVVGIDPGGMDVRAKFGIVRVEFDPPISESDSAAARLEELLASNH